MDFQTSEAYKCYNTRNRPDDKLPPLDFQDGIPPWFSERSFADGARTSAEFFAYMMTIRPDIPSDNTTKEFMVQSSPRNIRPKEKETKPEF
ncbi:hypothetical protein Focb16_v013279 [Fusarium oxysporum f. sp. cubense]|uniref:Uncharacterized protein n=1 Tax=Fusarium oxysporum f. sp. cubense TaxID=61366 RepID=A0A559KNL2_FUSOC|nr:hypothetical protein Focb16_v013279 [Fusarium oxysporum f. sp. cubense]